LNDFTTAPEGAADWTILDVPGVTDRAEEIARKFARKFDLPTVADADVLLQELLIAAALRAREVRAYVEAGEYDHLCTWLWCRAQDYVRTLRSHEPPVPAVSIEDRDPYGALVVDGEQVVAGPRMDGATYTTELVRHLLPAVAHTDTAYGMTPLYAAEPGMPRGFVDPSQGCTLFAHLADIRTAWQRTVLPLDYRRAVFMRLVLGYSASEVAAELGCCERTADRHVERAVERLADHLNGRRTSSSDPVTTLAA
jgi:hypothetical protein